MSRGIGKVAPPGFPEEHLRAFFVDGLRRRSAVRGRPTLGLSDAQLSEDYNVMGFLYFLTLAFGALRASEPHHVFLSDIEYDFSYGSGAIISLWHPSSGPAPGATGAWKDREAYLAGEYGLRPHQTLSGHKQSGWKNLLLEETVPGVGQRSRVFWVVPEIGRLFWRFHTAYVRLTRPRRTAHPYYYCSLWGPAFGDPWTLDASQDLFDRTVRAIGLQPSSARGICRHAFRHRIMHWLIMRGVPPEVRRVIMHHQSMESQSAYGRLPDSDVNEVLRAAGGTTVGRPIEAFDPYRGSIPIPGLSTRFDEIGRELAGLFLGERP